MRIEVLRLIIKSRRCLIYKVDAIVIIGGKFECSEDDNVNQKNRGTRK